MGPPSRQPGPAAGARSPAETARRLRESVRGLVRFLEGRAGEPEIRRQAFDQLHRELEFLRGNLAEQDPGRLFASLIILHDDLERLAGKHGADRGAAERFSALGRDLLALLSRQGVERMPRAGGRFDPRWQRAVETEAAPGPADDQCVRRIVREGFRRGARILRPQEVVIARFKEGDGDGR